MAKSKIETKFVIQEYPLGNHPGYLYGPRAVLSLFVTVDGEDMGSVCIMSGAKEEVIAFSKGEMSLLEVRQAWNRNRPIRKPTSP